jgi:amiloride-sensitive sodium channel
LLVWGPKIAKNMSFLVFGEFLLNEKSEVKFLVDFLANFGGVLRLFIGFCVLSLMEIFYFLSIRIICNLRLHGHWAGTGN